MSETINQLEKFKKYSFIDLSQKKTVNLVDIINENYTNSKSHCFYVVFLFSATWLPDSSIQLADKLRSFYQIQKQNFQNFELIFLSSDKSFAEYKAFMNKNNYIRYTLDLLDQSTKVLSFLINNYLISLNFYYY